MLLSDIYPFVIADVPPLLTSAFPILNLLIYLLILSNVCMLIPPKLEFHTKEKKLYAHHSNHIKLYITK